MEHKHNCTLRAEITFSSQRLGYIMTVPNWAYMLGDQTFFCECWKGSALTQKEDTYLRNVVRDRIDWYNREERGVQARLLQLQAQAGTLPENVIAVDFRARVRYGD